MLLGELNDNARIIYANCWSWTHCTLHVGLVHPKQNLLCHQKHTIETAPIPVILAVVRLTSNPLGRSEMTQKSSTTKFSFQTAKRSGWPRIYSKHHSEKMRQKRSRSENDQEHDLESRGVMDPTFRLYIRLYNRLKVRAHLLLWKDPLLVLPFSPLLSTPFKDTCSHPSRPYSPYTPEAEKNWL